MKTYIIIDSEAGEFEILATCAEHAIEKHIEWCDDNDVVTGTLRIYLRLTQQGP